MSDTISRSRGVSRSLASDASGDTGTASRLKADLDQTMKRWDRHTRDHNAILIRRIAAAFDTAGQR